MALLEIEIQIPTTFMLVAPTPWVLIVAGVVCVVVGIAILMNKDDPNARGEFKQVLGGVWAIALGVMFSWVGLAGLNAQEADPGAADQKAAQKAYAKGLDFFSALEKLEWWVGFVLSIPFVIALIVFTVSELIKELRKPSEHRKIDFATGVIITLILLVLLVGLLVNWWLRPR